LYIHKLRETKLVQTDLDWLQLNLVKTGCRTDRNWQRLVFDVCGLVFGILRFGRPVAVVVASKNWTGPDF
jgi:hypothetical protein